MNTLFVNPHDGSALFGGGMVPAVMGSARSSSLMLCVGQKELILKVVRSAVDGNRSDVFCCRKSFGGFRWNDRRSCHCPSIGTCRYGCGWSYRSGSGWWSSMKHGEIGPLAGKFGLLLIAFLGFLRIVGPYRGNPFWTFRTVRFTYGNSLGHREQIVFGKK